MSAKGFFHGAVFAVNLPNYFLAYQSTISMLRAIESSEGGIGAAYLTAEGVLQSADPLNPADCGRIRAAQVYMEAIDNEHA